MQLKRAIYHIAGRDYESNQPVIFTFNIQRVSIENFLNLEVRKSITVRNYVITVSDYFNDYQHTSVDNKMKAITVKCFPETLCIILEHIGVSEYNDVYNCVLNVRNSKLRAIQHLSKKLDKKYSCFDPVKKSFKLVSNTPLKINGRMAIINGKLWRRYYN